MDSRARVRLEAQLVGECTTLKTIGAGLGLSVVDHDVLNPSRDTEKHIVALRAEKKYATEVLSLLGTPPGRLGLYDGVYSKIREAPPDFSTEVNSEKDKIKELIEGFRGKIGNEEEDYHIENGWCFVYPPKFLGRKAEDKTILHRINVRLFPGGNFIRKMAEIADDARFGGVFYYKFANSAKAWDRFDPIVLYLNTSDPEVIDALKTALDEKLETGCVVGDSPEPTRDDIGGTEESIRAALREIDERQHTLSEKDETKKTKEEKTEVGLLGVRKKLLERLLNEYIGMTTDKSGERISSTGTQEATAIALHFVRNLQKSDIQKIPDRESIYSAAVKRYEETSGGLLVPQPPEVPPISSF